MPPNEVLLEYLLSGAALEDAEAAYKGAGPGQMPATFGALLDAHYRDWTATDGLMEAGTFLENWGTHA